MAGRMMGSAVVKPISVAAPLMGWNVRDALEAMEPEEAIVLDNWYPDANGVSVRGGSQIFCTLPTTAPVETLVEYFSGPTRKFLAAAGGSIYDISSGSPVLLGSGFGSSRWQTANFKGLVYFVNGVDAPQVFNGSALSAASFTAASGFSVTLSNLVGVAVYQNRLFLWEVNKQGFWFAGPSSITGTISYFDLSMVSQFGGNLTAVTTISNDGGTGLLSLVVFVMAGGDLVVYQGTDPSNAATWSLVSVYRGGAPAGPRAVVRYGADVFVTTADDHVPLSTTLAALKSGTVPARGKIAPAVQAAFKVSGALFGWEAVMYPAGRRLIFNIPNTDGSFDQHIFNTANQAWCRFVGLPAITWCMYRDAPYFGAPLGQVFRQDTGALDAGDPIFASAQQAWNTLETPRSKRVSMIRSLVQCSGGALYTATVGYDYNQSPRYTRQPSQGLRSTLWDVSLWDVSPWSQEAGSDYDYAVTFPFSDVAAALLVSTPWDISAWGSPWSDETVVDARWRAAGGVGDAVSIGMQAKVTAPMSWIRTDLQVQQGSNL